MNLIVGLGEVLKHDFVLTNTGNATLEITAANTHVRLHHPEDVGQAGRTRQDGYRVLKVPVKQLQGEKQGIRGLFF